MTDFLRAAKSNPNEAVFRNEAEFLNLPFTTWTNNFGTTFWDTAMQFLAALHNVPDWKQLKRRQRDDLLHSFVWAETNSIERWSSTPSIEGADFQAWRTTKTASERHLDSFATILNIFRPHIAVVMNWSVCETYWDCPLKFERIGDHVDYAFAEHHETHVFHIAHPTWLRGSKRAATFDSVLKKWNSVSSSSLAMR